MAMDKDRLGNAIVDALKALNGDISGANEATLRDAWKAIADEIIIEMSNAAVAPGSFSAGPDPVLGTGGGIT